MKCKLLTILVISVFLISVIGVALGASTSQSSVEKIRTFVGAYAPQPNPAVWVTGSFRNNGESGVYGTVTATATVTLTTGGTKTFTNTSSNTYFPPGEDVSVKVIVEGVEYQPYWQYFIKFDSAASETGPESGGTSDGGTGDVNGPSGNGSSGNGSSGNFNIEGIGGAVAGVVVIGAAVAAGVIVVRKRRVTEESLRRLSSYEFQDWVIKRVSANPSSQRDSYLGIDAYTAEGYPVQIRQDNDVGKRAIDSFAAAMARNKQRTGTIVAFGFGNDAAEGVMKARLNYKLEVKTVTVKELLANKSRTL
jgi:hypothetical protein